MKDFSITAPTVSEETNVAAADMPHKHEPVRLLATVEEAGTILRMGRTSIYDMLQRGLLERRKLGNATRITMRSINKLAGY